MNSISSGRLRENRQEYKTPKIIQYLFLLYFLLKPFYIFESGSFQPSDCIFILSFFIFLYYNGRVDLIHCKFDYILCIFVLSTFVINAVYFLIYRNTEFIYSTLYYVFNLMLVLVARVLLTSKEFITKLFWVCRIGLYLQVIIFILGLGKYYMDANGATYRYLGTFNDPNQLAFYMFASLMVMFMIEKFYGIKCQTNILDYAAFLFILYHTASLGMLLAFAVFIATYVVVLLATPMFERDSKRRKQALYGLIVICLAIVLIIVFYDQISPFIQDSKIFERLLVKEEYSTSISESPANERTIWQDRNIDKLYLYPQYNIFGAGQGYFGRFWRATSSGEIHSTLLSILFCYGIIPTSIFLYWIWKNVRKTTHFLPVFLALAVESLILLNQRQPLFWMIFLLSYSYRIMEEKRYEDAFYTRQPFLEKG